MIMNENMRVILAFLLVLILVITPAAAGLYSSRIPAIHFSKANSYGIGSKDMTTKLSYLSAVRSFNYQPLIPSGFSETTSSSALSLGDWDSYLNPPVSFGCGCGCS